MDWIAFLKEGFFGLLGIGVLSVAAIYSSDLISEEFRQGDEDE